MGDSAYVLMETYFQQLQNKRDTLTSIAKTKAMEYVRSENPEAKAECLKYTQESDTWGEVLRTFASLRAGMVAELSRGGYTFKGKAEE